MFEHIEYTKSNGAFRTAVGDNASVEYQQCRICYRVFEFRVAARPRPERRIGGLGSYSLPSAWDIERKAREQHRREQEQRIRAAKSMKLEKLFAFKFLRCVCDKNGDKEHFAPTRIENLPEAGSPKTPLRRHHKSDEEPLAQQLDQLKELFNAGALTREQFEAAKNKLLGL